MTRAKKVILYHVYGKPYLYRQVVFSILTLYQHLSDNFEGIQIVIYTDKADIFLDYTHQLPLSIELLTKKQIQAYKGQGDFVHRVKLCIIRDCFLKYRSDILYLDSDTYFCKPPQQLLESIGPGTSVMNSNDYDLTDADKLFKNNDWLLIHKAIKNFTYNIENNSYSIPLTTRMWNAGVIGMSLHNEYLVEKMLHLTDQIYSNIRVFTAEQFAVSFYLQMKSNVISSGETVFHYWQYFEPYNYRKIYNYHIKAFFRQHENQSIKHQAGHAVQLTIQHQNLRLPNPTIPKKIYKKVKRLYSQIIQGHKT